MFLQIVGIWLSASFCDFHGTSHVVKFTPSTSTSEEFSSDEHSISTEVILQDLNPKKGKWSPLPGKFSALDHYIDKCRREIDQMHLKEKCNQYNLPRAELAALRNLRNRSDVVIRPADKGGAFVVWEKELYLNEAHRQLSDGRFYQRIPSIPEDATKSNQETVKAFIAQAIAKQELPQSATNLIVQHPRKSKLYLLPKIHKPGNPGRPIVSACQCLTELLASYLDKVTAPFVRGLDSYVKDFGHMLTILNSLRFRGEHRFIFTMDIKSLYTVIPIDEGLRALKHEVMDPPTHTLLRMAELALTLNSFVFNGEHYKQIGGVAMGSKLGPNYACLFVGYVMVNGGRLWLCRGTHVARLYRNKTRPVQKIHGRCGWSGFMHGR